MTETQTPAPRAGKNATYRFAALVVKPVVTLMFAKRWYGTQNIPQEGGVIVAANHASLLDPLTAAHFLYNANRPPRILAKESLWKVPFVGWILRKTNMIPVARGSAEASRSLETARERLDQGFCIAVFPEGTLTRDPEGWPMQARTGVARLALQSRKPVIPLAQWGVTKVLPRGGKFPTIIPRQTVHISAGPAVDLSDLYDKPLDSVVLRQATDRIMQAITDQIAEISGQSAPNGFYNPRTGTREPQ
ncbi:lysophospholipid acyltransferase family protein [Jonesia quinghaiensis]|uniref:lysophospholipid acyltransferase family protein n=1 Tax=Jonesia quinghaiensis TaxID=262806 RepID=UPI0003FEF672|nr:lysophospholipid acyltransferase family protein [Jonesia quinghaiensis]